MSTITKEMIDDKSYKWPRFLFTRYNNSVYLYDTQKLSMTDSTDTTDSSGEYSNVSDFLSDYVAVPDECIISQSQFFAEAKEDGYSKEWLEDIKKLLSEDCIVHDSTTYRITERKVFDVICITSNTTVAQCKSLEDAMKKAKELEFNDKVTSIVNETKLSRKTVEKVLRLV